MDTTEINFDPTGTADIGTIQLSDLWYKNKETPDSTKATSENSKTSVRLIRNELKKPQEEQEAAERKANAIASIRYLQSISEKYSTYFQTVFDSSDKNAKSNSKNRNNLGDITNVLMREIDKVNVPEKKINVMTQMSYFQGTLWPYQIEGVAWMTMLFKNRLSGILADEMGLGKTIQVIALLCHLYERKVAGPYLIVAPLSTLPNWKNEFKRFAPQLPVVIFHGSADERRQLRRKVKQQYNLDDSPVNPVIVTSFEVPIVEKSFLELFKWQYIIVDEGQRIKNHESQLAKILRNFHSKNRLILTGTPLQNNMVELWSLLNFLMPHIFYNMDTFASLFDLDDVKNFRRLIEDEKSTNIIATMRKVLEPFMLRRLKNDVLKGNVPKKHVIVYCPLSELQHKLYGHVIDKDAEALMPFLKRDEIDLGPRKKRKCTLPPTNNKRNSRKQIRKEQKFIYNVNMRNPLAMFKKIVDHPYLVQCPLDPNSKEDSVLIDENLIQCSGKMQALDILLPRLKADGHKVLLFSTLTMMLDLIEEFMIMRGYDYRRLDGNCKLDHRDKSIHEFNNDPDVFIFLISTRAGGLGLNLTAADTVIFYDRDWNPQVDLQAESRCHRIGQTKPVMIYSLIAKYTIDEKILGCGILKRRLERIVMKNDMDEAPKTKKPNKQQEKEMVNEIVTLYNILLSEKQEHYFFTEDIVNKLLDRSDLYENKK